MSALEALTANYTDSEEEDRRTDGEEDQIGEATNPALERVKAEDGNESSASGSRPPSSTRSTPTKLMRLVSYGNEDRDEEDGGGDADTTVEGDKDNEPVDMEIDTEDDDLKDQKAKEGDPNVKEEPNEEIIEKPPKVDAWTEGMLQLPPEPPGSCSQHLQEIVNRVHQKKKERGYDMNAVIQDMKSFRNPSIYQKLINFCNIDEHGTNFPKDLYDGHLFGPESYYDELAKAQKIDMEKREKAAKERMSKESKRSADDTSSGHAKRRSKWDQVGPASSNANAGSGAPSSNLPVLRAANVSAAVPASSTKTIPAFGMLKRH